MRNLWIRIGCFLTGHNYGLVRQSSEVVSKDVLRYTASMILVCTIWAFVGYSFTQRYLMGSAVGSICGALVAVIIVIQIERQIILSDSGNKMLSGFRIFLAFLMAFIGAVIIDQIMLKQDIELEKISYISNKVDSLLPAKSKELKLQIAALDSLLQNKEIERQNDIAEVAKNPLIKSVTTSTQSVPTISTTKDSAGNTLTKTDMKPSTTVMVSSVANPKQALIATLDADIAQLRNQRAEKDKLLLNIRPNLEKEVSSKTGFLDELKVMVILIKSSWVAFVVWLLWLLFLLSIELLVLFNKKGNKDKENDYEKTILHQMNINKRKIDLFAKMGERDIATGN